MGLQIRDNRQQVVSKIQLAKQTALVMMGVAARQLIQGEIMGGYGDPIWDTGNLYGSISYDKPQNDEIHVGTNVEYAPFVHEGTYKMTGRPFIKSALQGNEMAFQEIAEQVFQKNVR